MPVYFWNDPEFKAYKAAYFNKFEGKQRLIQIISLKNPGFQNAENLTNILE